MDERIDILEWDSDHFGLTIGRIRGASLTKSEARDAVESAHRAGLDCLYFLAPDHPTEVLNHAIEQGFVHVDTRLTLHAHIGRSAPTNFAGDVRDAEDTDLPVLRVMARAAFTDSRFFRDPNFSDRKAAELYAIWVEKSVDGRIPARVFVAESADRIVGFATCNVSTRDDGVRVGRIGLIAVAPDSRGRGVGSALMSAVGEHYRYERATRAEVVTQARNVAAQELYGRHGYSLDTTEHWLHWWNR